MTRSKRTRTKTEEAYRLWALGGVKLPGLSQKGLAVAIGVSQATVSKMLSGQRRIPLSEVAKMAEYFGPGHPPPNGQPPRRAIVVDEIPVPPSQTLSVEALIAPGYWGTEGTMIPAPRTPIPGRLDARFAGIRQYACAIRDDPDHYVICAAFDAVRPAPLNGDKVHVRQTRENGEYQDTIRTVEIDGNSIHLVLAKAEDDKDAYLDYPSTGIEIRGLVIGHFIAEPV